MSQRDWSLLVGERQGMLTLQEFVGRTEKAQPIFRCLCDCGVIKNIPLPDLRPGRSKSCGCFRKAKHRTHGLRDDPLWQVWNDMLRRCNDPECDDYKNYGQRGIKVCERWLKVENFVQDMRATHLDGATIERERNEGDYEPGNCVWATRKTQTRNRRNTLRLTFEGSTRPLAEWAEVMGIPYQTLKTRIDRGWAVGRALKGAPT